MAFTPGAGVHGDLRQILNGFGQDWVVVVSEGAGQEESRIVIHSEVSQVQKRRL